MQVLKTLLEALSAVQAYVENGTHCEHAGICGNVADKLYSAGVPQDVHNEVDDMLRAAFETWPMFSGDTSYPVPGDNGHTPATAYNYYAGVEEDLWQGEYGAWRKDLLRHCIEYFLEYADA